jgi:hypothetical protein
MRAKKIIVARIAGTIGDAKLGRRMNGRRIQRVNQELKNKSARQQLAQGAPGLTGGVLTRCPVRSRRSVSRR